LFAADLSGCMAASPDVGAEVEVVSVERLGGWDQGSGGQHRGQGAYSQLRRVRRPTACSAFAPSLRRQGRSTPRPPPWPCSEVEDVDVDIVPKISRSTVMRSVGRVPAVTPLIRRCASTTSPGATVHCQQEKSNTRKRPWAMKLLRSRLYEIERGKAGAASATPGAARSGSGDRSEKIRTTFADRLTDHASGIPATICRPCWMAISPRSSKACAPIFRPKPCASRASKPAQCIGSRLALAACERQVLRSA